MANFKVVKSKVQGSITVPASKSHTLRAILFGSLGDGKTIIRNYLPSSDAHSMINACRLLGAKIELKNNELHIEGLKGKIEKVDDVINAGNSGIVLRFITALAGLSPFTIVITGDHSIRHQRPLQTLITALNQLGANAYSTKEDGFAPVVIKGPMKAGKTKVNGQDSQPVSSLLIASSFNQGSTEIVVENPGEKPWILLTLEWLDRLGIKYVNNNYEHYVVHGKADYKGFDYTVPSDLSSVSFPLAAAIIADSELTLNNIDMNDTQGDKELIYTLKKMGANIEINDKEKTLKVLKGNKLKGITADINTYIDAIVILAVIATYANGETKITNAAVARQKECDRIKCITLELKKMGANITELEDGLIIQGSKLHGAKVFSHHDHRMAMSLMVAGLGAEGETVVEEVECTAKTYPNVAEAFQKIGAKVELT